MGYCIFVEFVYLCARKNLHLTFFISLFHPVSGVFFRSDDAKIQEAGLNMMRSKDPAERSKGKQLWRMGLRSGELNRNANQRIKDEAKRAGEEWAQDL